MKQFAIAGLLATLAACGGGGGDAAGTSPSAPASYKLPRSTVNDFASRQITWSETYANQAPRNGVYWETVVTTTAGADGSFTSASVDEGADVRIYTDYAADGGIKAIGDGCSYVFAPAFAGIPGTLTPGQSWDTSSTRTCVNDSKVNTAITSKGSVAGVESLTIAAGTFSALKTQHTETYKFAANTAVTTETCWRDTVTGIELKCDTTTVRTPADATTPSYTLKMVSELGGYAHAATGRQKLNSERFAGRWQVWYKGTAEGTCSVWTDRAGSASGTCESSWQNFGITGSVDAQGVGRFSLTGVSGPGFSGSFESPLKISGTWSAGTDNGTWYMTHR